MGSSSRSAHEAGEGSLLVQAQPPASGSSPPDAVSPSPVSSTQSVHTVAVEVADPVIVDLIDAAEVGGAVHSLDIFQDPRHQGIDSGASPRDLTVHIAPRMNACLDPLAVFLEKDRAAGVPAADVGLVRVGNGVGDEEHVGPRVESEGLLTA